MPACWPRQFILGPDPVGYERPDHPVQIEIARVLSEICGVAVAAGAMGIDGCSVPTFALPLCRGGQGLCSVGSRTGPRHGAAKAARRLMLACFAAPVLVAGEGRFDTIVMTGLAPSVFIKGGAEGVHCAALPELGIGIALKVDDGAKREKAETALARPARQARSRARPGACRPS